MTLAPQTENTALTKILTDDGQTCEENNVPTAPLERSRIGAETEANRAIAIAYI